MDLSLIREILLSLAAIAVIGGILVAATQLRDLRRLRQVDVVMQLFDRFDHGELAEAGPDLAGVPS